MTGIDLIKEWEDHKQTRRKEKENVILFQKDKLISLRRKLKDILILKKIPVGD